MSDWFLALSLTSKLWLAYVTGAVSLLGLATWVDLTRSRHVDGAGGWLIFGAMILSFWGLVLTALASLLIALLRWLW
ncbi:MAG: hypothetical protein AVDCRST_MAG71-2926 [uncultured Lysobacter sp.]|uniref:Uncharacterized protein n=1 Tax=uncultured Lysobacter sp. TaxID=271060 RepID=A0A6J4MBM0_9GAMM|nr:MAG: hypothetical protein AVDCRST_MAG71-2926 [uncultured Lysobacter sp.]